jgi:peptidyl-prolyl cis-trans isomerase C
MKGFRLLALALLAAASAAGPLAAQTRANAAPAARARAAAGAKPVAKPAAVANDSDRVLVRIGTEVVTPRMLAARLEEIPEQYRAQYQTPEGRQQLLDRFIDERVWMRDAEVTGLTARPEIVRQLAAQRRDLLIRTHVNEVMATNAPPSDSAAKVYYEEHLDEWRMPANATLRHIQLRNEFDARRVLSLVRVKGADWDKLAKQWSVDTLTKANGGLIGTATRDGGFNSVGLQPAWVDSALALGEGAIAGPWRSENGWHVVRVDAARPESVRDFEQVRAFIVRQLQQEGSQRFYQDQLRSRREKYRVQPDSAAVEGWRMARKSARELFQEAQAATTPEERITAYRRVVDEYPEAEVAPQALFMVGFVHSEELKDHDAAEPVFRELLKRYPKSELAASAQWMVDHMRTDQVPDSLAPDSSASGKVTPKERGHRP